MGREMAWEASGNPVTAAPRHRVPPTPPRMALPPNSFAALKPTKMGRNVNRPQPRDLMVRYHQSVANAELVWKSMTLVMPLIRPAAMMPGSSGTKTFAMWASARCRGLSCLALLSAFTSLAIFAASRSPSAFSSALPRAMPVSLANASPTRLTVPGPRTICSVSDSMTLMTPSTFLIPSRSTLPLSRIPTRRRVMHVALELTLSAPPIRSSRSFAVF